MSTQVNPASISSPALTGSAVSWGAIIAGAFVAAGVSLILVLIGAGLGFSAASPWSHSGLTAGTIGISAILWLTLTQLVASGLGGYLAGRLRGIWPGVHTHEVFFRDTAHGLLTWALATLAVATLFSSLMGSIVSGGTKAVASVAGGAGEAAAGAAAVANQHGGDSQQEGFGYFSDQLLRTTGNGAGAGAPNSGPSSEDVTRILSDAVQQGGLTQDDRQYLGQVVARRTGLSQQEAEQRVTATYTALQARLDTLKAKAKQAADEARKASAFAALWFAITLLIGAFIAAWAATFGGRLRDKY
jgi:hypothetical protein